MLYPNPGQRAAVAAHLRSLRHARRSVSHGVIGERGDSHRERALATKGDQGFAAQLWAGGKAAAATSSTPTPTPTTRARTQPDPPPTQGGGGGHYA